jgi:hypothetical protein
VQNEEPIEVDVNYLKQVEEQKKKREEFLRRKAEARRLAAISRLGILYVLCTLMFIGTETYS